MNCILPINPLILDTIKNLDVSDNMKLLLNKILENEESLDIYDDKKNFKASISSILKKYADDTEIMEFCKNYESD